MTERLPQAPDHLMRRVLLAIGPPPLQPDLSPAEVAETWRAQAQRLADSIWHEAWHAGATWGLERSTQPVRMYFPPSLPPDIAPAQPPSAFSH